MASELYHRFELQILRSWFPIQMRMFLILNVFYALFLSEKNKSEPVGCTSTMHLQTRKDTKGTEIFILHLLLIFWSIPGSFDTVTSPRMGFHWERAVAGLGPSALIMDWYGKLVSRDHIQSVLYPRGYLYAAVKFTVPSVSQGLEVKIKIWKLLVCYSWER